MKQLRRFSKLGTTYLVTAVLCVAAPSAAVTRRVPSEYPTIQAGIDAAIAGDVVLVAPGSYPHFQTRTLSGGFQWTSCAFLKDGVIVRSEGGASVTEIDLSQMNGPQSIGVIARFLPSTTTAVEGFKMEGPRLGVYAYFCGNVTVRGCEFSDFDGGPTAGGALLSNSNVAVINCEFTDCKANGGGAIFHGDGAVAISGSTFRNSGNVAVYIDEGDIPVVATVTNCLFVDNYSNTGGAGGLSIGIARGGMSTVSGCTFIGNHVQVGGAGALSTSSGDKLIENNVFIGNSTAGVGGAIRGFPNGYVYTIRYNTFIDNDKGEGSNVGGSALDLGYTEFHNNVVVGGRNGAFFPAENVLNPACNVFWDNPNGVGIPISATDRIQDPLFCDRDGQDFTLRQGSPCLPDDPLGCGLIGAFGLGCGVVSIDAKSWGAIKSYYHSKER